MLSYQTRLNPIQKGLGVEGVEERLEVRISSPILKARYNNNELQTLAKKDSSMTCLGKDLGQGFFVSVSIIC